MRGKLTNKKYDTRGIKEMLLYHATTVYYEIGKLNGENTQIAEELTSNALDRMLDADTGSREEYMELLSLSFMLKGMADDLRLHIKFDDEEDMPEENKFPLFDDEWPF